MMMDDPEFGFSFRKISGLKNALILMGSGLDFFPLAAVALHTSWENRN